VAKKLKINVQIVPNGGSSTKKKVEVAASGASVKEICDAAGISTKNMEFTVNGKPADLKTHVSAKDALEAKEAARPAVTVSERPSGS
jgi:sulfur carrier protein ThiS